jgi:general secretion pathway protein A
MVLDYYRLAEQPFGVTPDPRFLYLGSSHREALASALYGVSAGRGFTALIAKPGMGKTTLLFDFLRKIQGTAKTVFLFQSQASPQDLIRNLLSDLHVEEDSNDLVRLQRKLNETLVAASDKNKRLVVVIDEAQNLDDAALEIVRMLSNFETAREKLMHIMLAGQPQLAERLASPQLVQLRQRISMIARLKPFDESETSLYIEHRLRVAGYDFARPLLTKEATALIAERSEGIPRNINNLCFNAMSLGFVAKKQTIDVPVIREVLDDLDLKPLFDSARSVATNERSKPSIGGLKEVVSSYRPTWLVRVVLPLAAIIALVAFAFNGYRISPRAPRVESDASSVHADAKSSVAAGDKAAATTPPDAVAPTTSPVVTSENGVRSVTVAPKQTLSEISLAAFGKYDQAMLEQFQSVNPWLSDPDHIESGQKVVLPSVETNSRIHPASEQVPHANPAEAEKP